MARVLIIDDDPMIAQLLEGYLTLEGYHVATAPLAEVGFAQALQETPDLIILDVHLPDATGFQMMARFRKNPSTKDVPIIIMTGEARFSSQQSIGKSMGASEYVLKPFDIAKVGARIHELMGPKRPLPPKEPMPEPIPSPPNAPEQTPAPIAPIENRASPVEPLEEAAPREEPVSLEVPVDVPEPWATTDLSEPRPEPDWGWRRVWIVLTIQSLLTGARAAQSGGMDVVRAVFDVVGGWLLLTGLAMAAAAMLGMALETRRTLQILSLAVLPVIVRTFLAVLAAAVPGLSAMGVWLRSARMNSLTAWIRPIDYFELISAVILFVCLRQLPGSTLRKSLIATLAIGFLWLLTGRAYFHPS